MEIDFTPDEITYMANLLSRLSDRMTAYERAGIFRQCLGKFQLSRTDESEIVICVHSWFKSIEPGCDWSCKRCGVKKEAR